jgi:hypothetical protein
MDEWEQVRLALTPNSPPDDRRVLVIPKAWSSEKKSEFRKLSLRLYGSLAEVVESGNISW